MQKNPENRLQNHSVRPKFGYIVQLSPTNHKTDLQHCAARVSLSLLYPTPLVLL